MNYASLESEIVARITSKVASAADVLPLPETGDDMILPSIKARITVAYNGSTYETSETTDVVAQPETITMQIVVQSRKLRGAVGIYTMLSVMKSALLGWKSTTTEKIHFGKAEYVGHENSVWTYALNLTTVALAIEEPDTEDQVISKMLTAATTNYENITVESQTP